ncbi:MAG: tetratricopeptide repeat protein [Rhodothermales bacterium]|nr:tetratricopeptide repeat protein [Rhodothermales bacterium]
MRSASSLSTGPSFLSAYRLPVLTLPETTRLPDIAPDVLPAVMHKDADPRNISLRMILGDKLPLPDQDQAAMHAALAASFLQAGDLKKARRHAEQSVAFYRKQWAGHRVLVDVLMAHKGFVEAAAVIAGFKPPAKPAAWDRALPLREWNLCAAACAWRLKAWDTVAERLAEAFPEGLASMPAALLEDYFRLTLYRNQPDEAGRVAATLMTTNTLEFNDELLQTLVQQGWTQQALPLYRSAFTKDPRNQLLRRRLVALCIREGNIEEARRLTAPGALDMNARASS